MKSVSEKTSGLRHIGNSNVYPSSYEHTVPEVNNESCEAYASGKNGEKHKSQSRGRSLYSKMNAVLKANGGSIDNGD